MKMKVFAAFGMRLWALALVAVLVPGWGLAQEAHSLRGDQVAIYNLAGGAEIVRGSGNRVEVEVSRGGDQGDRLRIEVQDVDGREALVVHYPDDRVVYPEMGRGSRTQVRLRDDGTFFGDRGSWRGRRVEVAGSGRGMEAWADLTIRVPAGTELGLFLAVGETDLEGVEGSILIDVGSGAVRARNGRGQLLVDTGSGSVSVEVFDGELEVDTGSGNVELRDIRGSQVLVDTGSGSVRGEAIRAGSVEVDTGSGEIDLRGVAAPDVVMDTGSGRVFVGLLEDIGRLEIDTGSGAVTVEVPASVGATVEMDSGSGGIDLELPFEAREVKRDYVRGVLGDGAGRIEIDTGSGRIRLTRG